MKTTSPVLPRLLRPLQALLISLVVCLPLPTLADSRTTAWGSTSCSSSGCHGNPVKSDSTGSGYQNILNSSTYDIIRTTRANAQTWIQGWCSRSQASNGGSGTTMCGSSYASYLSGISSADAVAVFDYITAARTMLQSPASGTSLTFGSAALNVTSSLDRTIFVSNYRGFAASLSVTSSSSDFTTTNNCSSSVPAGSSTDPGGCTVTVTFRPLSANGTGTSRTATLTLNFTAGGSTPVPFANASASYSLSGTALVPQFSVGSWSGSFAVQVGSSVSRTATVTNNGNTALSLSALALGSNLQGDFQFSGANTCSTSATIAASGGTCTLGLTFSPTVLSGTHSVSVNFTHNAPVAGTTASVSVVGTPQQGTFGAVTGGSGAFGTVLQGSTSATQSFTVSNSGSATLSNLAFNVSGTNSAEFVRNGGTCGTSLAATTSCTVIYQFTPSTATALAPGATSAKSATLTISSSNASNASPTVGFSGTAQGLANVTASAPAAFPSTLVGTTSGTQRVITLTNPRANAVTYTLSTTGTNAGDFTTPAPVESCAGRSIPGGNGTCTITYSFTPALALSNGTRNATATFTLAGTGTDPAPTSSPLTVALSGPATTAPAFAISSSALTLSSVENVAAAPVTLTVSNNGTAALNLSGLTLGGANPGDYALGGTCSSSSSLAGTLAAPRSSCTVVVTFTPGGQGARNATLTIAHNDTATGGGSSVVTLNGTGNPLLSPVLSVGGTAQLAFGNVLQGGNSQLGFTISNSNPNAGSTALQLSGLALSGAAAADYSLGGNCTPTSSLAAGAACNVTVTFAPQAAGARSATLDVTTSNATNASIALSGTGVALADATLSGVPLAAFPSTLVTTTSTTTGTVTVNNPRANSITYGTAFSGANAADFQVGSESCATRVVPTGGSCTVQVRFAPANGAAGARSAALVFAFTGFGTDPNPAGLSTALSGTAALPAPAFSISSTSLVFTAVVLSPTTTSALLTNTGTAALSLSGLAFAGAQASDFRLHSSNTCTATTSLAPSSSCTLVVQYDPAAAGSSSATLTLSSNAANSPHTLTLSGTATPTPRPQIAPDASQLVFASAMVGTSSTLSLTVTNSGNADLNFSSLPIAGAAAGDFTRGGSCAVGTPVAPAATCTVSVTFVPTAAGTRLAALTLNSDASNNAAWNVALSGTATPIPAPVATLSTTGWTPPFEFGSQTVGGLYPNRTVTLTNTGTAPLVISAVTVDGTGFSHANPGNCPASLGEQLSCNIDVSFAPTAVGSFNGSVKVLSNAAGSPAVALLHGNGTVAAVASLVWDPLETAYDFGSLQVGAISGTKSFTLKNAGPGGARLTVLNAVGPDAGAFSVTFPAGSSCAIDGSFVLYEGQTCQVDVRFAPGSAGAKRAYVQVASSGSFPSDLLLTGTGQGGSNSGLSLSARSLALGSVRVGSQSAPVELTLSAAPGGSVQVTGLAAGNGFVVQTKSCPAVPFTLAAGSDCTVTVAFSPQAVGAATGALTVTSDAANGTTQQVALTGSGEEQPKVSGGGCSISQGDTATDPTLWLLLLLAMGGLAYRGQQRRHGARRP